MVKLKQGFIEEPVHQNSISLLLFTMNTGENPESSITHKELDTLNHAEYKVVKNQKEGKWTAPVTKASIIDDRQRLKNL